MKNIPENLNEHLQNELTTLAFCWKLSFTDETVLGFTAHDEDIVFETVTYKSKTGFTLDQYKAELQQADNLLEIFGIIDSEDLSEEAIKSGAVDNAVLEVFLVNYKNLDDGRILIKKGKVSQISRSGDGYIIGITGLLDNLDNNITEIYSPLCRARFGDSKCGIDLAVYTFSGVVTDVLSEKIFLDNFRAEEKGYFDKGVIKFITGANTGFSTEVKHSETTKISLNIPFPNPIIVGDEFEIIAGCNKKLGTCSARFNNAVNFRGEPHIPGINEIFKAL